MRLILPIIFIAAAGLLFFGMISPAYEKTKELRVQNAEFDTALMRVEELKEVRERLTTKYNSFSPQDIERLHKLLPDTVDNVRLILDVSDIAEGHNLRFEGVTVETMDERASGGSAAVSASEDEGNPYNTVSLSFTLTGVYDDFVAFMADLERSLRLVDVETLVVSKEGEVTGLSYEVTVLTYWLK